MKPLLLSILVVAIAIAYFAWSAYHARKVKRVIDNESDLYLEQVRAMRAMPGVQPGVAVSIQDQDTGEFYYYPRDSETRVVLNTVTRASTD